MSLFLDADSVEKVPENVKNVFALHRSHIKHVWIGILCCAALVSAGTGFYVASVQSDRRIERDYDQVHTEVIGKLADKVKKMRNENAAEDDIEYPFIGKSAVHSYDLKFVENENNGGNDENIVSADNSSNIDAAAVQQPEAAPVQQQSSTTTGPDVQVRRRSVAELFNEAVDHTNTNDLDLSTTSQGIERQAQDIEQKKEALTIGDLPERIRNQIPKFVYNAHNYSTDASKRSITLNGDVIKEGSRFQNLDVVSIAPNYVILRVQGQSFSQRAMEDYK